MKKRFSEEQIVAILRAGQAGEKTVELLCREHGIAAPTYYGWKRKYGSMAESDVKRLRELEKENARLKRLLAERDLEVDVIKELLHGLTGPIEGKTYGTGVMVPMGMNTDEWVADVLQEEEVERGEVEGRGSNAWASWKSTRMDWIRWQLCRAIAARQRNEPDKVDWMRCIPFIILHAGCFAVLWVGVSPIAVRHVTLLPDPDSPTIPNVSPRCTLKETPSTAFTTPSAALGSETSPWTASARRPRARHSSTVPTGLVTEVSAMMARASPAGSP